MQSDSLQGSDRPTAPRTVLFFHTPAYFLPAESLILLPPDAHLHDLKALILLLLNLGSTQISVRSGKQEPVGMLDFFFSFSVSI